jgi:hypothetical protein
MMSNAGWRKSTHSGSQGGNCVEVGQAADGRMLVRDTKHHGRGPVHRYTTAQWRAFVTEVRNGQFDQAAPGR